MSTDSVPDHRPQFPTGPLPGVAIAGFGAIARSAHLPAYRDYGVPVRGVWSRSGVADPPEGSGVQYASFEDLLADPQVGIVDIATPPAGRIDLIAAAVRAGKHVLAQKPLTFDLTALASVLQEAQERGVVVAVNQNARWAPPWRLATQLIADGAIGRVSSIVHLHDKPLPPLAGTPFDDVPHMLITDYLLHWFDISRCWLSGSTATSVSAVDSRVPGQDPQARNPWTATVRIGCDDGAHALLHIPGSVPTGSGGCPFWIHGTEGSLRGSLLLGSDRLELERDGRTTEYPLTGQWFTDGFAGAMAELMSSIAQDREPFNSAAQNLASLQLVTAAWTSADGGALPVPMTIEL